MMSSATLIQLPFAALPKFSHWRKLMNRKFIVVIVTAVAFFHSLAIWADVIAEQLIQGDKAESIALGQSLTTPAGGPWNDLTFNWFDTGGPPYPGIPNPIATGTLFLLGQEYLGTPGAL